MLFNFIKNLFTPKFTIEFENIEHEFVDKYFHNKDEFFKTQCLTLRAKKKFSSIEKMYLFLNECLAICINNRIDQKLIISVNKGKKYFSTIFFDPQSGLVDSYFSQLSGQPLYDKKYFLSTGSVVNSIQPETENPVLEEQISSISYWEDVFNKLSEKIMPTCRTYYEIYQRRLSAAIDNALESKNIDDKTMERIIEMAREKFDYRTPSEIEDDIQKDKERGLCSHGVEPDCCPLGCGSI